MIKSSNYGYHIYLVMLSKFIVAMEVIHLYVQLDVINKGFFTLLQQKQQQQIPQ